MRLHDMQVTLSSVDAANRYQVHHQQLAAAEQAQEALNINARAELQKSQTQQTVQEQGSKEITEEEKRSRRWNKGSGRKNMEEKNEPSEKNNAPGADTGGGHIIDIRA